EARIREYESSPGKLRAFCGRCGSPVYSRWERDPETFRLRLGMLEDDPGRRPLAHFWVGEKAPWYAIADDLPQFARGPADHEAEIAERFGAKPSDA
ncbi:MAG: GFA family protein, partial [Myxococcota bacterium]|nr:GFA family protein [Myxococcota bacterium]